MATEESIKIVSFITPGAGGGLVSGRGWHFQKLLLYFGWWFRQTQKDILMMCLFIPITKQLILQLSSAIVDFYLFYDGLLIWQEVSVQSLILMQVTGKTHGPLVCFLYWTSRIHQEYIIAFQDKINYSSYLEIAFYFISSPKSLRWPIAMG